MQCSAMQQKYFLLTRDASVCHCNAILIEIIDYDDYIETQGNKIIVKV